MPPARRSNRPRRPTTKYDQTSSWDKDTLRLLRESSESLGSSGSEDGEDGREVAAAADDHSSTYDSDEAGRNNLTHGNVRSPDGGGGTGRRSEQHQPSSRSRYGSGTGKYRLTGLYAERLQYWNVGHSRGLKPFGRTSKAMLVTYENVFGPAVVDLRLVLNARDRWGAARDITLPSRMTLADIQSSAVGPPFITGSHATKAPIQLEALLSSSRGRECLHYSPKPLSSFLLEPLLITGKPHEKDMVKIPAQVPTELGNTNANIDDKATGTETATIKRHRYSVYHDGSQSGWILNTGRRINALAWMPNSEEEQYLAIAYRSQAWERAATLPGSSSEPPTAFTPSPAWVSTIEILKFTSTRDTENEQQQQQQQQQQRLDIKIVPDLITTTCLKCGDLRQLTWSPGPFIVAGNLQILAALSSDGLVRVHVYKFDESDSGIAEIPSAGVKAEPPANAVFTDVVWVTATDLAVGASDGSLRVYNVLKPPPPPPSRSEEDPSSFIQPYLIYQLHDTYITTLSPASPSSSPFYIASRSAAGDMSLTDLRNPTQDRVDVLQSRRSREGTLPGQKALVYAPFTKSWITFGETTRDTDELLQTTIECRHLRHFYGEVPVAKLPPLEGQGTTLASSPHHPSILIGSAKGTVFATNYLRTVIPTSVYRPEMDGYLQKICEYRFQVCEETTPLTTMTATKQDIFYGADVAPGTSSFTGPSKPVPLDDGTRKRRKNQTREAPAVEPSVGADGSCLIPSMTFSDEQAVTTMAWNPNHDFAGWAAVGWGSGIVRVIDLSHDAS